MSNARATLLVLLFLWGGIAWAQQPPSADTAEDFFGHAGSGLRGIEDRFRPYWSPHIANSHRRILQAAAMAEGRERVLVLGAGSCTEIPLEVLAALFEQVVLVDLDRPSLQRARETLPADLRGKVEIRVADFTSFALPFMKQLEATIQSSSSAEQAFEKLDEIYGAVSQISQPPSLPMADLVVSSLLLSELHRYPRTFGDRLMREKFGTAMSRWPGHERAQERLQRLAIEDHIRLLSRFCRATGAVYLADTVARGPLYENITPANRRDAMRGLLPQLVREGLFRTVFQDPTSRQTFSRGLQARQQRLGRASIPQEELEALLLGLAGSGGAREDEAAIQAAETFVGMLCLGHLAPESEIPVFERLLGFYQGAGPRAFEPLVPVETLVARWGEEGLRPVAQPEGWWWIEYPCSVSHRAGAFKVMSWILTRTVRPGEPSP